MRRYWNRYRGFYRSRRHSIFLGVCGGIADRFDFSPLGVRLLFLVLQFTFVPFMILIYIAMALLMKREPSERVLLREYRWDY